MEAKAVHGLQTTCAPARRNVCDVKAYRTYELYSIINNLYDVYSPNATHHSMGGPRKDFFVRNPV